MRRTFNSVLRDAKPLDDDDHSAMLRRMVQAIESDSDITLSAAEALHLFSHLSTSMTFARSQVNEDNAVKYANMVSEVACGVWCYHGGVVE